MKRVGTLLTVVVALLASCAALAAVKTSAFRVEGMKNDVAVRRVTAAVKAVPGVQDAVGSAGSAILMVRYDNAMASAMDLADAVASAGYTLNSVEDTTQAGQATKESTDQKAKAVLTDFAQVLGQTKEFLDQDRYGIVRNLAPAIKVRRDAILSFEKATAPVKSPGAQANSLQLAQTLARDVDRFAAAAEARDKATVKATFPTLDKDFKALAEARNLDNLVAPPVATSQGQQSTKSIEEQLKEYITKVVGGK